MEFSLTKEQKDIKKAGELGFIGLDYPEAVGGAIWGLWKTSW